MAKYGKKAQSKVKKAMHERKQGTLRSGKSGKKVTNPKQAIAIGLSEARRAGAKVPRKSASRKNSAAKAGPSKSSRTSASRKTTRRKPATAKSGSSSRRKR
jgi:hypothetical protein